MTKQYFLKTCKLIVNATIMVFFSLVIFSCDTTKPADLDNKTITNKADTLDISYAQGFQIIRCDKYTILKTTNPWQGATGIHYTYYLSDDKKNIPKAIPDKQFIKTPVKKIVCMSTTHIATLQLISETSSVLGVSGAKYVCNPKVQKLIKAGEIVDIGYDENLNYELIVSLQPDLIVTYGVGNETATYIHKLRELGMKVVINADYLENSPLGRVEWVRFMAEFFCKNEIALKQFNKIEKRYIALKEKLKNVLTRPTVFCNIPYKDTWYVPGGKSYFAQFINDAGGEYIWNSDNSRESLPLSIEVVFAKALKSDIWLNPGQAVNYSHITSSDARLAEFQAYKDSMIFNNNKIQTQLGGNDFYESGITNPDLILSDLIRIFHPELMPDYKFIYYQKIK